MKPHLPLLVPLLLMLSSTSALATLYDDGLAAFRQRDFVGARHLWEQAAESGDTQAQLQLGILLVSGKHATRTPEAAEHYLRTAAEHGNPEACFALAVVLLAKGAGNTDEGFSWLRAAADKGHRGAQSLLEISKRTDLSFVSVDMLALEQEQLLPASFSGPFRADAQSILSGRTSSTKVCATCHATGIAGAPKIGSPQWHARRTAEG